MKPGPAMSDGGHLPVAAQLGGNAFGKLARLLAGVLRKHHRGVRGHIAMCRVTRRLNDNPGKIGAGAKHGRRRRLHGSKHRREQMLRFGVARHEAAANAIPTASQNQHKGGGTLI